MKRERRNQMRRKRDQQRSENYCASKCARRRSRAGWGLVDWILRNDLSLSHLGLVGILILELLAKSFELGDAGGETTARLDFVLDAIQPKSVFFKRGICPGRGRRSQLILVESDGQRGIGGQDELGIPLPPVSDQTTAVDQ